MFTHIIFVVEESAALEAFVQAFKELPIEQFIFGRQRLSELVWISALEGQVIDKRLLGVYYSHLVLLSLCGDPPSGAVDVVLGVGRQLPEVPLESSFMVIETIPYTAPRCCQDIDILLFVWWIEHLVLQFFE
ncbi:hypothetical protein KAR91_38905 [Candidatus Pacearchaeota archaeon]|nr:hypothetical protein [Candidatus Pacearchaeota archaeon]